MNIATIRRANLLVLMSGYPAEHEYKFAEAVDTASSYLSQLKKGEKRDGSPVNMGSKFARKVEQKLGLNDGWMDQIHEETKKILGGSIDSTNNISSEAKPTEKIKGSTSQPSDLTQAEKFLAAEQGRSEALMLVCKCLVSQNPHTALPILKQLAHQSIMKDAVTNAVDDDFLKMNYAQIVIQSFSSALNELLEFATDSAEPKPTK